MACFKSTYPSYELWRHAPHCAIPGNRVGGAQMLFVWFTHIMSNTRSKNLPSDVSFTKILGTNILLLLQHVRRADCHIMAGSMD